MDINNVLSYLKEELKDIPAVPKNIHYTDFEGLYYILQYGLKGQAGGYTIKSPKTKSLFDMELATVRNSHKLSKDEQKELSLGAIGGVRINLFTDRILAAHRGTRKDPIAELPAYSMRYLKDMEKTFKQHRKFDLPKLFDKVKENFLWKNGRKKGEDMEIARAWVKKNHPELSDKEADEVITSITLYNRGYLSYYNELRNREREERFILKKNIPVKPDFMEIAIDHLPSREEDEEFCKETAKNYLKLLDKHYEVFVDNKNFRLFKNYLRDNING